MPYDYASELLSGGAQTPQKPREAAKGYDYASELLRAPVSRRTRPEPGPAGLPDVVPPGKIGDEPPAGILAQFKAGFPDDPGTQIKIYAAARFPDLTPGEREERYGIRDGEIVYVAEDGKVYQETPDTLWESVKRIAAQTGAHAPSIIMGMIGAMGGPGAAALGAAGGEGIRKTISHIAFDEPQTTLGSVASMGKEAALAAGGEVLGRGVARGVQKIKTTRAGRLAKITKRDIPGLDSTQVAKITKLAEKHGIELNIAQITESPELMNLWTLLSDMPDTADKLRVFQKMQLKQIDDAVYQYLDELSPKTLDPLQAGEDIVEAAEGAIKRLKDIRAAEAKPLYDLARKSKVKIDAAGALDVIDGLLDQTVRGDPSYAALTRIRKMVERAKGNLSRLDRIKRSGIDDVLKKTKTSATLSRELKMVKDELTEAMDAAVPEYAAARAKFAELSPAVEEAEKSIVGKLARMESDKAIVAAKNLISSAKSSPETIKRAKALIQTQNPEAWEGILRVYLQDVFENIKTPITTGTPNLGGWMHKNIIGNERQRKLLKAAMSPDQYQNLENFMEVLRRTGLTYSKESATATRQVVLERLKAEGESKMLMAFTRPLYTYQRIAGDYANRVMFGEYTKELAETLLSEEAGARLVRMKRLKPRSVKLLKSFGIFLGLVVGGEFSREMERAQTSPVTPSILEGQKRSQLGRLGQRRLRPSR